MAVYLKYYFDIDREGRQYSKEKYIIKIPTLKKDEKKDMQYIEK
jgi:hypothetical protein